MPSKYVKKGGLSPEGRARLAKLVRERKPRLGTTKYIITEQEGVQGKACGKCSTWRPLEKFGRHATCAGGRRNICSTCEGRQASVNHREARIAAVRRYQKAHPEAHKERKRVAHERWKERIAKGPGVSTKELRALRNSGALCAYCKTVKADTLDHVVPLSRGGPHQIENLLPACKACNFSKHDKTLDEWRACARKET